MICVPDAATLPSVARPMRRSNSSIRSFGNPFGNTGNARSSTMPIISQCPVTESLPGERSAMRPNAAERRGGEPFSAILGKRLPVPFFAQVHDPIETERAQCGNVERHLPGHVADRVAAVVAIARRIGQLADADAVEHDYDDSGKGLGHVARMDSTAATVSGCSPELCSQTRLGSLRNQINCRRA